MQVCVRPLEANLTHDTELFGRMVHVGLGSLPTARYFWEDSFSALSRASWGARTLAGTTLFTSRFPSEPTRS